MLVLHLWRIRNAATLLAILFIYGAAYAASSTASKTQVDVAPLRQILALPAEQIDLAQAEVTIERLIDPSINAAGTLHQLDLAATAIAATLPVQASNKDKLNALRVFVYQAGPWNGNHAFHYDLDDPMGTNIKNKLLSNYLVSHKGNCVSMPLLLVVLGQKLGLQITAARAPMHVFVKYRSDDGQWINLEATGNGSAARDVWIRENSPMTDQAIANGLYMQPLSQTEVVVLMADTLVQHLKEQHQEDQVLALTDLLLKHHPRNVDAMLQKSGAYFRLADQEFFSKYMSPDEIPARDKNRYDFLVDNFHQWQDKATALGWRPPTTEQDAQYMRRVDAQKKIERKKIQSGQ